MRDQERDDLETQHRDRIAAAVERLGRMPAGPARTKLLHKLTGLGVTVAGFQFKPDASEAAEGARCYNCGRDWGVAWISGAGRHLCFDHQDDY